MTSDMQNPPHQLDTPDKIASIMARVINMSDGFGFASTNDFESAIVRLRGIADGADDDVVPGLDYQAYLDLVPDAIEAGRPRLAIALADQGMMSVTGQVALADALGFPPTRPTTRTATSGQAMISRV